MSPELSRLLTVGRNDWESLVDQMRGEGSQASAVVQLETEASALSALAAEISGYLMHRGASGCSDSGHGKALAAAQKKLKRVRKALGYSYP